MPELPEVENTKEGLRPLLGARIQTVFLGHPLRSPWPDDFQGHLVGKKITALRRRAKYVLMDLDDQSTVLIHLGMSGKLSIHTPSEEGLPKLAKHDHFELLFEDGRCLRLNDPRRFGAVFYQAPNFIHPSLEYLGPEPLESVFTADYLWQQARDKTTSIKPFIMDQSVVVGVGNIYASEALFMAGIHPKRKAKQISKARIQRLAEAIQQVLQEALEKGGTTLRDYRKPDGKKGEFVQCLQVYGRAGEACVKCGQIIKEMTLGGRSSFYCAHCQH